MKKSILSVGWTFFFSFFISILIIFPSQAASIQGEITNVDSGSISGWAWNKENTNDIQKVEVHICQAGNPEPIKYIHVDADDYRDDLVSKLKDGWHGFSVSVDWSQLTGSEFKIQAYAVKDDKFYLLGDAIRYSKSSGSYSKSTKESKTSNNSSVSAANSTSKPKAAKTSSSEQTLSSYLSGNEKSLGLFTISGYCSCEECGSGLGITFSGTVPKANHTIAADLSILPLGTKVRIGNTVYTVEDIGSTIIGNRIDIYYSSHQTAVNHGIQQQEVFLVQ